MQMVVLEIVLLEYLFLSMNSGGYVGIASNCLLIKGAHYSEIAIIDL